MTDWQRTFHSLFTVVHVMSRSTGRSLISLTRIKVKINRFGLPVTTIQSIWLVWFIFRYFVLFTNLQKAQNVGKCPNYWISMSYYGHTARNYFVQTCPDLNIFHNNNNNKSMVACCADERKNVHTSNRHTCSQLKSFKINQVSSQLKWHFFNILNVSHGHGIGLLSCMNTQLFYMCINRNKSVSIIIVDGKNLYYCY